MRDIARETKRIKYAKAIKMPVAMLKVASTANV
eukprot:CAMPEP_0169074682 /NCGR_PEP_ID=MMETSP1015-20121227/7422_1 /TAXON_ID=342587 /ORGANISM="Karlodinium micrum, Strain CCMP2283" /LENGTH=32 /DNA_ID= /DNA_START= /DNA_END= /DNA_ORIENTATION=